MAVEVRKGKVASFRAYWRNPNTGKVERGETRHTREEAELDDARVKLLLKTEPWAFNKEAPVEVENKIVTFNDAAQGWLARKDITENTRRTGFVSLRPAMEMLGALPADKITCADLRRYEKDCAGHNLMQSTIHRRIKLVRLVLGWARTTCLIDGHLVDGHRVKKGASTLDPPPTPDEVRKIVAVSPPHIRRAILLTYYLGLRFGPSETLSVSWADFDALNATLTVRCAKNSERPWRKVCLGPAILSEMLKWQKEDEGKDVPAIVHFHGKKIQTIWVSWESACQRAGITRHLKPYSLRHTFATEALAHGADLKSVANSMGHQDVTMILKVYQSVLDQQRRDVATSIPDVLGEPLYPRDTPPYTPSVGGPAEAAKFQQ